MSDMTKDEQITQRTYNLVAENWAKDHDDEDYWREEFKTFVSLLPEGRVLDVGCGYGRGYLLLSERYDYVGLDFSSALLAEMHKRFFPKPRVVNANMRSIPDLFAENSFDGFWAAASLLHIEKSDIGDVLKGISRVVKPGGIGFISLKKGEGEGIVTETRKDWPVEDERFFAYYQLEEFLQILRESGFDPMLTGDSLRAISNTTWIEFLVSCDKIKEDA